MFQNQLSHKTMLLNQVKKIFNSDQQCSNTNGGATTKRGCENTSNKKKDY